MLPQKLLEIKAGGVLPGVNTVPGEVSPCMCASVSGKCHRMFPLMNKLKKVTLFAEIFP